MAIMNILFTKSILFNPDVQKTISSLSLSNLIIVKIRVIKKVKGISFVRLLGIDKNEYEK